jgi:hypothetical protein
MRRALPLVAIAMLAAGTARAAVLPFEATLEFSISTIGPIPIADTGVATVNGSDGGLHLTQLQLGAGAVSGGALTAVTDPAAFPITGVRVTAANAAGTIAETSGGALTGAIGLPGFMKICLFGTAGACVAPVSNLSIPLTPIGQGGGAVATGAVNLSVFGAPWTTGVAAIGTITSMGYAHGPASGTSSTAQTGGSLRLVTPIYITTNIGAGPNPVIPAFAILTLRFVPEPTTALLLGAGIALLGAIGRRKRGCDEP